MWIDVFPLDAIPEDPVAAKDLRDKIVELQRDAIYPVRKDLFGIHRLLQIVRCLFRKERSEQLLKQAHDLARANDYEKAKTVGSFSMFGNSINEYLDKSYYEETTMLTFGDESYCAPSRYDEMLTISYGDYMTPPKEYEAPRRFAYYVDKKS
jgi:phosphorylcholine metabolism protein LicD